MMQFFMTHFVEVKRWQDFRKPKSQGEKGTFLGFESAFEGTGDNGYPGGIFDPMGMSRWGSRRSADCNCMLCSAAWPGVGTGCEPGMPMAVCVCVCVHGCLAVCL
jgi:hypothetical protein